MVAESKEFKVKDDDTKYYLTRHGSGNYFVWWYDEEKVFKEVDYLPKTVQQHFDSGNWKFVEKEDKKKPDAVNHPKHYAVFDDIEAIEIIARSMSKEMFKGYCFGNLLKYRLRAGGKDELQQEISKANKYKELFEKYKDICQ